jgi:1-acyl-sn-glycerol-3-phosphate acyltransferase
MTRAAAPRPTGTRPANTRPGTTRPSEVRPDGPRSPSGWQFTAPAIAAREATAWLFGPLFSWFLRGPAVRGAEHLDALEGPAIMCPTHASHLDFSALRLALGPRRRRRLAAAAAADYFAVSRPRWFIAAWLGSFAFDRSGRGGRDSIRAAQDLLDAGWHVLVFPEGTRSTTGDIGPFRPGVGLLAVRTGRQVVPVRIRGTAAVLPKGARRPRRSPVEVRFGAPLRAASDEDPRAFTARLEAAVRSL